MKLSIITINFNNLAGLKRTYESVVCQTWTDYEWIVIDGGSTDGSREFIEEHQDKFAYWCSEPDKGVYNAMNKGIGHAEGVYLLFLNSGDCLYNAETLTKAFANTISADILSGQVVRMDNGRLLRTYDEDIFMQLFKDTLNHQGTFIRKKLFDEFKYDESLKIVSDWKFWIDAIVMKNASVEYSNIIVASQDMTGVSSTNGNDMMEERQRVLNAYIPSMLLKELDDLSRLRDEHKRLKNSEYVVRSEYLLEHCPTFYVTGRRFLAFLIKLSKMMGK